MKIVNTPGISTDWKTQKTEETTKAAGGDAASVSPEEDTGAGAGDPAPPDVPAGRQGSLEGSVMRMLLNSPTVFARDAGGRGSVGGITQEPPVADPLSGEGFSLEVRKQTEAGLHQVYQSPQFKQLNPAEQKHVLDTLAGNPPLTQEKISKTLDLLGSAKNLSPADRKLALEGFRAAHSNPAYATNLKQLIDDQQFKDLSPAEQTAVLSQAKNYPDPRSVKNIGRMLQKDWFTAQDLGDKQRSLKTVARLSQHNGDRKIIDNTLDRLIGENSDIKLVWKRFPPGGDDRYGEGGEENGVKTLKLNQKMIPANDDKMPQNEDTDHLTLDTVAHEVNHVVNGTKVETKFKYFEAEYRAWYSGFQADHGRPPTNEEAMNERIQFQLDPDNFYGVRAKAAMENPQEAQKFFDFLKSVTGLDVNANNWQQVIQSDPASWPNLATSPAPEATGNLDNH